MHFVHCKRIPQQGRSLCSSFCSFIRSDKILICLKACLWNPGSYHTDTKCAPIQCTVWPRNVEDFSKNLLDLSKIAKVAGLGTVWFADCYNVIAK